MADWRIYLLGPPEVVWDGRPLVIPRRQVRALLYRLATYPQAVPREQLCFLFWSDRPEATARRNLSHMLTHLRRALPTPEVLLVVEDHVGLDHRQSWSDTVAFEQLCSTGGMEALQQAVGLYRGPFLAGFSLSDSPEFEVWVTQEQHAFERLYLEALAAILDERTARGEYEAAIACARQYLATDNLAEEVHRRLIELYALTGDRRAALRQFERCAATLERELGVRPLPATRAVYQAVLAGRLPQSKRSATGPLSVIRALPGLDVPLVGRDEAWACLEEACTHACAGRGQMVLISGEPGIGKSRLIRDFATHLQDQALILAGESQPEERSLPYQPVAQALRSALDGEYLIHVQPIWLAESARLVPELRVLRPDLPPPLPAEPEEARTRLFEALCQTILGLAAGLRPVLLCLDDLHWADGTTLDWLGFLGRRLSNSRLLILGTYRHGEMDAADRLRHNLARLGVLSELKLAGLDTPSVLKILRHLPRSLPADETLAERFRQATGGNPFFLLETLRTLIEAERRPAELIDLDRLPLPNTVRQAVEARLARLSPQARQVLEAAAILGGSFSFDSVHLTAGRGEMETVDGLDELVARQLLVEVPSGYRFQHDLIRRATEAGLSLVRRQLLHRRASQALEQLAPEAVAALARHFDAGVQVEQALHYHDLAARRAETLFAWEEAENHQSRMLELLEQLDPDRTRPACLAERGRVLVARAHQRYLQGRLAERDADLSALATLAKVTGNESLRLQELIHRTRYLNLDAQYEKAIAAAKEGIELARHLGDFATHSRLLAQIGFAYYFLGQPRLALTALESALVMASEGADAESRGRITHILGYVYFHLGDYARSLACQQEAYTCHQRVGDHNRVAWDGLDIGAVYLEIGRLAEARQYLDEHLALACRIGARPAEAYGVTLMGCWQLHRGDYVASSDCFQQALAMQEELHSEHGYVAAELGMGLASYHLADLAGARQRLERAVKRGRSIGHRRRLVEALVGLGLVEIAAGRPSTARRRLTEAVTIARESDCQEGLAVGLAALARAGRHLGHPTRALTHATEAVRVAREFLLPVCEMWGEMEMGLALWAQGEFVAASKHTERAVALVPQAHEGWIGTEEVHRAHARILESLGQVEAAEEQKYLADTIVEEKARLIPSSEQRHRYFQFVRGDGCVV